MSSVEFKDVEKTFSQALHDLASALPEGHISVRDLLGMVGEHGMLMFCMILTIPFLTPLPLPGISTVFGLIIMLISLGVILNRVPWLPRLLMNRTIATHQLGPILRRGANFFTRLEKIIRPRLLALTHGATLNRLNGVMLLLAGFFLILPLPLLPLSNTFPGWAVLLMAIGILQRDGLVVLVGYVLNLLTFLYFGGVALLLIIGGGNVLSLFNEAASLLPPVIALP